MSFCRDQARVLGSKIAAAAAHCNNNNNKNNNNNNNDNVNYNDLNYYKNIKSRHTSRSPSPAFPLNNSTENISRISNENLKSLNIRILEKGQKFLDENIDLNLTDLSSKIGLNKENESGIGNLKLVINKENNSVNDNNDNTDNNLFTDLDENPCFSDLSISENRGRKKNKLIIDTLLVQNILNQNKCRVAEAHLYTSLLNNNTIIIPNHNTNSNSNLTSENDTIESFQNPFLSSKIIENKKNNNKNGDNNDNNNDNNNNNNNNNDDDNNDKKNIDIDNNNNSNNNVIKNEIVNNDDKYDINKMIIDDNNNNNNNINSAINTSSSQSNTTIQKGTNKIIRELDGDNTESGTGVSNNTHRFFSSSANRINEKYNKSSQQTTHTDVRVTDTVHAACTYNIPLYVTPEENPLWQITQQKLTKNRDFVTQEARRRLLNRRKAWIEIGNR